MLSGPETASEEEPRPQYWYEPTQAPTGGDWPQLIKNQWVGTRLPVMSDRHIIAPKPLLPLDPDLHTVISTRGFVKVEVQGAIDALRADGKEDAADFWSALAAVQSWEGHEGLIFVLSEGELYDAQTEVKVTVAVDVDDQTYLDILGGRSSYPRVE